MILSSMCWASVDLSGRIVDEESGQPIEGAEVYLRETKELISTNKEGEFQFESLLAGTYSLVVLSLEYETNEQKIELAESKNIVVRMRPFQQELSEVVITERKEEIFALKRLRQVEGTSIYAGKKSEVILLDQVIANTGANNSRQIFSQVVGLNIYESIDAGLQLNVGGRGLDPNRTSNFNTRQNGYDISADVLGYPESYYTPPAEALEQIQVVRGAASLQYGTQFGGLINFKMKSPSPEPISFLTRQTVGSYGLFNSFNSLSGTQGKFSYTAFYNYKRGDGFRPNSGFESNNVFGSFGFQLAPRTKLTAEFTYLNYLAQQPGGLTDTMFELNPDSSNRARNWFEIDWKLFALKLEQKIGIRSDLSVTLFGLNAERNALGFRGDVTNLNGNPIREVDEQDIDGNFIYNRDLIKGTFRNWGVEAKFLSRYALGNKEAIFLLGAKTYLANNEAMQGPGTVGTDAHFQFDFENAPAYPNTSDFDFPNTNLAIFGENIFFLSPKLSITPGFRYEWIKTESIGEYRSVTFNNAGVAIDVEELTDNRFLSRSFILLGLGLSYDYSLSGEFYANVSENYRSVTFSDIRIVNPSFAIDPDIKDESGYTTDLGVRGKWNELMSYDISVFGIFYNDRIDNVFNDRAQRVRGNIGDAVVYGLETFIDLNVLKAIGADKTQGKLNVFFNGALTDSEYTKSEIPNVQGKKVEFVPLVNVKTGLRFGYKNLLGSFLFTYVGKQFTDAENSRPDQSGGRLEGIIGPIPSYTVMDLSLSYKLKKWKLEAGANNLLDQNYFTRRATGYPGPGIIPAQPRSYYLTLEMKI